MKKLKLAIIGQGRSGKGIHGVYYRSERNTRYEVKYVVDADEYRRNLAKELYPGCEVFADYRELFGKEIDIIVNATYSEDHYPVSKDCLAHGYNVLCEKPFGRTRYEAEDLIKTAKDNGVIVAAFQQSFYAPFFYHIQEAMKSGKYGDIVQVSIRYNGFARRWDWQTMLKKAAGGAYNTGPHPFGVALGCLDFTPDYRVLCSKLYSSPMTSGDSDDYCKAILTAPGKPLVDVEVSSLDAYNGGYNVKLMGTKGTFCCTTNKWWSKYIVDGENIERPLQETFLEDANRNPAYCGEKLITHEESGTYDGTPFDLGTAGLYEDLYFAITEGRKMFIPAEIASDVINVIEQIHTANPLERKF